MQADAGVLLDDDVEWSVSVNPFHGRSGYVHIHTFQVLLDQLEIHTCNLLIRSQMLDVLDY